MAVIAVLGVLVAGWTLIGDVDRVVMRALAIRHQVWLRAWGVVALGFVLLVPFAEAWIFNSYPPTEAGKALTLGLESLLLVMITAASLWPLRWAILPFGKVTWDLDLVNAATGRIQELIRQGKASTAAAVVARFAPMGDRPRPDDGDLDAYEEVLDWCLRHEAFVNAMVCEQTMTVANMLKARGWLMREHSDALLEAAFLSKDGVFGSELSQRLQRAPDGLGEVIPPDCHLLHALFDDVSVAEKLAAWQPIALAMLHEFKLRKRDPSREDPDLWPPQVAEKKYLRQASAAGIHFFGLMAAHAMRQGNPYHMWIHYYVPFVNAMVSLIPADRPDEFSETPTGYHRYLSDMQETLLLLIESSKRLNEANPNAKPISAALRRNENIPKACAMIYGRIMARLCQPDVGSRRIRESTVHSLAFGLRTLLDAGLRTHADVILHAFAEAVRREDRPFVLDQAKDEEVENGMHAGARDLLDFLQEQWKSDVSG